MCALNIVSLSNLGFKYLLSSIVSLVFSRFKLLSQFSYLLRLDKKQTNVIYQMSDLSNRLKDYNDRDREGKGSNAILGDSGHVLHGSEKRKLL